MPVFYCRKITYDAYWKMFYYKRSKLTNMIAYFLKKKNLKLTVKAIRKA